MKIVLSDTSVLLNLLAGDCLPAIASSNDWQFAVCPAVRDEVKRLRDSRTGEMVDVDIRPFVGAGLLQVLEVTGEEEQALYVESSMVVDDGEAMSMAIAAHRRLELAMDDKQAANHARRRFPSLRLWSTPEILKYWFERGRVDQASLRAAIQRIESRSRYFPPRLHPLAEWWRRAKAE
jgi:predicted nucleic acid-binding protein